MAGTPKGRRAPRGSAAPRPVLVRPVLVGAVLVALAATAAGCVSVPGTGAPSEPSSARSSPRDPATPIASPSPSRATAPAARTPRPGRSPRPAPPDWVDDRRNTVAFAPLDRPDEVTVEGGVARSEAWSTSKVLVVAAFLATTVEGDPRRLSAADRRLVTLALSRSDGDAAAALRARIVGRPGAAMTRVLRSIGDRTTTAPDRYEGLMRWSAREQVRFMAALASGGVVSRRASAYLLSAMRPVEAQAWGLGTVGARAYKGGWLREDTVTRQMGVLDGYAVAVVTDGVGPAVVQTDGDAAHVRQLDRLARQLEDRLDAERGTR